MINKKSNAKLPQNKKVGGVPRKDWKKVTDQDVELGRQKATKTGEYGVYGRAGINAPDYTGVSSDKVALYEHNRKVNKFAMETGVTPNYDSIQNKREPKGRDGMTYEVGEAMKNFYKSPDAAGKMKQAEKDFIKTQPAGYKKPSLDQARVAGGSRPMHQASTIQIDPMTGLPLQANAPAMGNFGGAMGMSNVPMYDQSMSPGAIAQSRAAEAGKAAGEFGLKAINKSVESKKAKKLGQDFYKQTFTDQVFSDTPNENVTKGSYSAVKGSSLKGVDGEPVYGKQQIYNSSGGSSFSIDKTSKDNYSRGMGKPNS